MRGWKVFLQRSKKSWFIGFTASPWNGTRFGRWSSAGSKHITILSDATLPTRIICLRWLSGDGGCQHKHRWHNRACWVCGFLDYSIWLAATIAAFKDPSISVYYQRKRSEGKSHLTALDMFPAKWWISSSLSFVTIPPIPQLFRNLLLTTLYSRSTIFFNCTFAAFFPSEEIGECIQPLFCTLLIFHP